MVFPDLLKIQLSNTFSIDRRMSRNEVHWFAHTVNNVHDCVCHTHVTLEVL
jgi:hypothetical protein